MAAGSGKTVLCSTVIDRLVVTSKQLPMTAVVYFYFDFTDTGKRSCAALVKSLITQLVAQSDSIPRPLLDLYETYRNRNSPVDDDDLIIVLRNIILTFHNVYIVLDALDESSDCEEVSGLIRTTQEWGLSRLHLLVTSRQLPSIEESFEDIVSDKICLQESNLNTDIAVYIADQLANDKILTNGRLTYGNISSRF